MKLINDTHLPAHSVNVNVCFDPTKGEFLTLTKKRSKEGRYEIPLVLDTTINTDSDKDLVVKEVSHAIYKTFENVSPNKGIFELEEKQANLLQEVTKLKRQYGYLTAISTIISRLQTDQFYIDNYTEEDLLKVIHIFSEVTP